MILMLKSRPEPHKKLKRFLSPAFTVNYIDNLENYFQYTMQSLLDKYQHEIVKDYQLAKHVGISVDFMDDLHNVALDMSVYPIIHNFFDPQIDICEAWEIVHLARASAIQTQPSRRSRTA